MVIEIDLNETNTKSFNSGGLIQENAKSKFFNLINKLLLEIPIREDYKFSKNSFLRVHNTILINGKRGVGKTSFILSMMDALVDELDICVLNIYAEKWCLHEIAHRIVRITGETPWERYISDEKYLLLQL